MHFGLKVMANERGALEFKPKILARKKLVSNLSVLLWFSSVAYRFHCF